MKVLLLGSTGWVGTEFKKQLEQLNLNVISPTRQEISPLWNPNKALSLLKVHKPDFVINCVGITGKPNVDWCETHQEETFIGNVNIPLSIMSACSQYRIPWGHVSSGCIYSGDNNGQGWSENDPPNFSWEHNNCSFYSGTKAYAESFLKDQQCYIWRLRMPFTSKNEPRNYLSKLLRYSKLINAINSLSYLPEFVSACLALWQHSSPFGIYNVVNPGQISTKEITEIMRQRGLKESFDFFENEEEFLKTVSCPRSNCVLSCQKLQNQNIYLTPIRDALKFCLDNWT